MNGENTYLQRSVRVETHHSATHERQFKEYGLHEKIMEAIPWSGRCASFDTLLRIRDCHPRPTARGGVSFSRPNRAMVNRYCCGSPKQTRPVDVKPAGFKTAQSSFCLTFVPDVVHPATRGNGSDWLSACPMNPKAPSAAHSGDIQATSIRSGLMFATAAQPFQLSSKPEGQHSSNTP